jgi:hypothetical protein
VNSTLSRHQYTEILKAGGVALLSVALIYFLGVRFFQSRIVAKELNIIGIRTEIEIAQNIGLKMVDFQRDLEIGLENLAREEKAITQERDPLDWIFRFMGQFAKKHDLDFDVHSYGVRDWVYRPKVEGYKLAYFTIKGYAFYHDFSSFVADLENTLPFARVMDLRLNVMGGGAGDSSESEKLSFEISFVNPCKSITE